MIRGNGPLFFFPLLFPFLFLLFFFSLINPHRYHCCFIMIIMNAIIVISILHFRSSSLPLASSTPLNSELSFSSTHDSAGKQSSLLLSFHIMGRVDLYSGMADKWRHDEAEPKPSRCNLRRQDTYIHRYGPQTHPALALLSPCSGHDSGRSFQLSHASPFAVRHETWISTEEIARGCR